MKLWTIQPYNVYEIINNTGIYTCNPNLSSLLEYCLEDDNFVNAYKWISKEMKKCIGNPPHNVNFPVWAWYKVNGEHKRPDMRTFGMRVFEKSVLIEIEIPDDQVLLSNFEMWHIVLNDGLYYKVNSMKNVSEEEWYAEAEKEATYYLSLSHEDQTIYKENGWKNIFSTDEIMHSKFVQATFWELKKTQIKKVWTLKGFPKNKYML